VLVNLGFAFTFLKIKENTKSPEATNDIVGPEGRLK